MNVVQCGYRATRVEVGAARRLCIFVSVVFVCVANGGVVVARVHVGVLAFEFPCPHISAVVKRCRSISASRTASEQDLFDCLHIL